MHGEHGPQGVIKHDSAGSSPHARGTQFWLTVFTIAFGIIPACTGNTVRDGRGGNSERDHPRMHGEHEDGA
ncbi:hypothetical protein BOCO_0659 [Bombiscardovia coagulans]|uniref:Uncharacterized protein n=1 Tax=Bombiscardovia coagulans TaxID=686666 RepID=A0A261ETE0_9BIFI|nr:hypothetical protein BOCO_0659 [Bombiscardovia coagulans]